MSIASGTYFYGGAGTYADLRAALADLDSGGLTGDLTLMQLGECTITGGIIRDLDLNGYTLTIDSAKPSRGKWREGFVTYFNDGVSVAAHLAITVTGAGIIRIQNQCWQRIAAPWNSATGMLILYNTSGGVPILFVQDSLFLGGGYEGSGLSTQDTVAQDYVNSAFIGFGSSGGGPSTCLRVSGGGTGGAPFVEHCAFKGEYYGLLIEGNQAELHNNWFTGSTYGDIQTAAWTSVTGQGNFSRDGSVANIDGDHNQANYTALEDDLESVTGSSDLFGVPVVGSRLASGGTLPLDPLAALDVEGKPRPGSGRGIAVGPCGPREILREHWPSRKRFRIDGDMLGVSGVQQLALSHHVEGFTAVFEGARSDGGDVRISSDRYGLNQLPVDIVSWDREAGTCLLWFKATVTAGEDYDFWVWFGDHNAARPLDIDDYGQFNVWTNFAFVAHCVEDPADGWLKDSSLYKHYGRFISADATTWQDGIAGGLSKPVGRSYWMGGVSGVYAVLPAGYYLNAGTSALAHAYVYRQTADAGTLLDIEGAGAVLDRFEWQVQGSPGPQQLNYRMPDANNYSGTSGTNVGYYDPHQLGAVIEQTGSNNRRFYLDGAADGAASETHAGAFTGSDSAVAQLGNASEASDHFEGYVQEIWLARNPQQKVEGYFATLYANLNGVATFFIAATQADQDGERSFAFDTIDYGALNLEGTDFYLSFSREAPGGLAITLNAIWEAAGQEAEYGLGKRQAVERRLRDLAAMVGAQGKLTLDAGTSWEQVFHGLTLLAVDSSVVDNNTAIEYSLTFGSVATGAGTLLARELQFGDYVLNAENYLVEYGAADRTAFKNVFRAAPIRIPSGPPLKVVRITALLASTGGRGGLDSRQRVEQLFKNLSWSLLGTEGPLTIDGKSEGTAHLASVQAGNLSVPDRVAVDLEFITGYGS